MTANMKRLRARIARRGLSLVEIAMGLVILTVVVAGVMLLYQNANTSRQTAAVQTQIGAVQQSVRSMYAGQADYTGVTAATVAGMLPSSMSDGTNVTNAFGGAITVDDVDYPGRGTNSGFSVTVGGLPAEACRTLAAADLGRAVGGLTIEGTAVSTPATPAEAQTNCANASDANTLVWIFS